MTPVDQTLIHDYKGDCFRACMASVLDLKIEDVPNFASGTTSTDDFWIEVRAWLDKMNLTMIAITIEKAETLDRMYFEYNHYVILTGVSPRLRPDGSPKYHAVVGRTKGYGIEIVHDPHPDRTGLAPGGYRFVRFIVKK